MQAMEDAYKYNDMVLQNGDMLLEHHCDPAAWEEARPHFDAAVNQIVTILRTEWGEDQRRSYPDRFVAKARLIEVSTEARPTHSLLRPIAANPLDALFLPG